MTFKYSIIQKVNTMIQPRILHKEYIVGALVRYIDKAQECGHNSERFNDLVDKIVFGGRKVPEATYQHTVSLMRAAKIRVANHDTCNASTMVFHACRNMGLVD